jgi:RNA polymerase sigma-70 factor (ECF subfamily)
MATEPGRAEELVQDVMLTIWQEAHSFDPARASADAWIFTIARNRRIDLLRRERRPMPARDTALAASASAESEVETAQRGARLVRAMSELPGSQADVLRRMYFEDKSLSDIASESGLPLGTVKSRARLALARLRTVLGGRAA